MEAHPAFDAASRVAASPSPVSTSGGGDAFEVKFRLTIPEAQWVEKWARERLTPDPHGDNGKYHTTSLYLDTSYLDIYHKSPGFRRSKYRLRRYGAEELVHLERKIRRRDRVRKRRDLIPLTEVLSLAEGDNGGWFGERLRQRTLRPICWVAYTRTAFQSSAANGPLRLTLDRDVVGEPATKWAVPPRVDGRPLMPAEVIMELKYRTKLPALFHELLATLPSRMSGVSKYNRCVERWNLARR